MLKLTKDMFTEDTPQQEGKFLWKHSFSLELIQVVYYPPKDEYGMSWEGYYGVASMRGRNVSQLEGSFCKIEIGE